MADPSVTVSNSSALCVRRLCSVLTEPEEHEFDYCDDITLIMVSGSVASGEAGKSRKQSEFV